MWQNIIVFAILAVAAGVTAWKFYTKFTGKSSCCGGGCTCSSSCGSESRAASAGSPFPAHGGGCDVRDGGTALKPFSGCGCGTAR